MNFRYCYMLLFLCFFSCEEDQELTLIDQLSVEAYLYANQAAENIRFTRIYPYGTDEPPSLPDQLTPWIEDDDGKQFELSYTGKDGIYENKDLIFEVGKNYHLNVSYNGELITASTYIPEQPVDIALSETSIRRQKIVDFTDIFNQVNADPIEVSWTGVADALFLVTVQNIEEDPELINELFENSGGGNPGGFDTQNKPSTATNYTIETNFGITHYGTHEVQIYSVNAEYAILYEANSNSSESLNQISTNIKNGFGIFTGIHSNLAQFEVTR